MKFEYWVIGNTKEKFFKEAEDEYLKRIQKYTKLNYRVFNNSKSNKSEPSIIQEKEAVLIFKELTEKDYLILLDERGRQYSSKEFSVKINKLQISSYKRVVFLTGGAYGFDKKIYNRAQEKLSLSKMTFSHQMIRTFFLEQFYRAFTILKNEKYHNE